MKQKSLLLTMILLLLSLTACQQISDSDVNSATNDSQTNQTQGEQQPTEQKSEEAQRGELLFQDERVSIYANEDEDYSVTILYGEYSYQLEGFNYSRPHCTTWEADADGDGTKELHLIHTIGSGTGVSVDALFVFEPNGENLDMYCHDSKEIQMRFNTSCSGSYDPEQQTLYLSYGESSYTCNVSEFYNRDYIATATNLVLISGHIIEYSSTGSETVQLSFNLSFESDSITSLSSYLPEDAAVSCLIRFNGTGFVVIEDLKFTNAPEYPWMMPEVEHLGYEEFFAEERDYTVSGAPWYDDYTSALTGMWFVRSVDSSTAYEWESDENGIFICRLSKEEKPLHRIPNTADLVDSNALITDTHQLYCAVDGKLLRLDVLTGERDTLYRADYIPDLELCINDVLYFLAISDGILSLNRLYLPTMTLDVLYTQTALEVPVSCYELYAPSSNRSVITWETINPTFWKAVTEILEGPESEYSELPYSRYFTVDYITTCPFNNEMVQLNFATLQDKLDLRPRMKCYYDPVADTYTEKYGIYDICFFGTGIHGDEEHFESYPEYRK